jgi:hypothetical protein
VADDCIARREKHGEGDSEDHEMICPPSCNHMICALDVLFIRLAWPIFTDRKQDTSLRVHVIMLEVQLWIALLLLLFYD